MSYLRLNTYNQCYWPFLRVLLCITLRTRPPPPRFDDWFGDCVCSSTKTVSSHATLTLLSKLGHSSFESSRRGILPCFRKLLCNTKGFFWKHNLNSYIIVSLCLFHCFTGFTWTTIAQLPSTFIRQVYVTCTHFHIRAIFNSSEPCNLFLTIFFSNLFLIFP